MLNLSAPTVFWPFWAAIATVWQLAAQNGQNTVEAAQHIALKVVS